MRDANADVKRDRAGRTKRVCIAYVIRVRSGNGKGVQPRRQQVIHGARYGERLGTHARVRESKKSKVEGDGGERASKISFPETKRTMGDALIVERYYMFF